MNGAIIAFDPCHACESHDMCSMCELTLRRDGALRTDKWISVEERLPEESAWYIVNIINHFGLDFVTFTYYTKGYGWGVPDVTHWMPLPKPPKMKGGAE